MRLISLLLIMIGEVVAGFGGRLEYVILGILMIALGLVIEYLKVHKKLQEWKTSKRVGTYTYTVTSGLETSEYEEAQEQ